MAKITLTIEADGPGDLHQTLAGLCDQMEGAPMPAQPLDSGQDYADDLPGFGAEQDRGDTHRGAEEGERNGAGKRRRRTKAELEADPEWRAKNGLPPLGAAQSAQNDKATLGSVTAAPINSPANLDFTRRTSSQPSNSGTAAAEPGKALFGIGAGAAAPAQAAPAGDSPEAAFKSAFRQSMSTRGAKATQDILVAVAGVRMTAEVKPEQYAALTTAFLAS